MFEVLVASNKQFKEKIFHKKTIVLAANVQEIKIIREKKYEKHLPGF